MPAWERDLMYPTSTSFRRWASNATVSDLGEVLHICIEELRRRVGISDLKNVLADKGFPLDEGGGDLMLWFDFNRDPPRRRGIFALKRVTEEVVIPLLSSWSCVVLDDPGLGPRAWAFAFTDEACENFVVLRIPVAIA